MLQLSIVVVSMGLFEGLLVGMSLGLLVLVIEGTLGSEAMFCSSDWLSGWFFTLGSVVLCSGNWFIGWFGPSGSAVLCLRNWFSGWFVGNGARFGNLGSKAPFSRNWLSGWQGL